MQRLKFQLDEEIAHAKDMIEPMELVKQRLEVSLQTAQEEVQVKTTQLKQYKKQVDALKEQVGWIFSTALWWYYATSFLKSLGAIGQSTIRKVTIIM